MFNVTVEFIFQIKAVFNLPFLPTVSDGHCQAGTADTLLTDASHSVWVRMAYKQING